MQLPATTSTGRLITVCYRAVTACAAATAIGQRARDTCRRDRPSGHGRRTRPSWRPGCPVGPERLRRVEVNYIGFDGQTHRGELVVHEDVVADVIAIFEQLHRLRYPIAKMRTVDHYPGAEDELSMEDNNSSAFNCRPLPSGRGWSLHAYGRAIDVNPLLNPYIDSRGNLEPTTAAPYLDRNRTDPGMLHAGDPAVRAFTDRGWRWGGYWRTPKDYQHFEHR